MEERNVVELIVRKNRQMFPKGRYYNDDGEFAIISFDVIEEIEGTVHKDKTWGTIIGKGVMPEIKAGKDYHMFALETYDEKYKSYGYEVSYIGDKISVMEDIEDIKMVLEEATSVTLANEIIKLHNIKDILENRDLEALKQVKGIGEKRCIQVMDNYHEKKKFGIYLIKLSRLGLSASMIKELVEKFSNYETIYNKIQENPYMLADDVKGIGFIKADELAGMFGIEQNSPFRVEAYTTHILKEKSFEGKSFVMTRDLIATIRSNTKDEYPISKELIGEVFESMRQRNKLWWNGNKSVLALPFVRDTEAEIADHLIRLMSYKEEYDISTWEETVSAIEKRKGFSYTDEQKEGIHTVLTSPVVVVTGLAGTGKTTVLEPMTQIFVEQQGKGLIQCALAGKASQRMAEVTGYPANTVHSTLEFDPKSICPENPSGFVKNEDNQLETDIIIWDEFSMADAPLVLSLLKAVKTGTKLCLVGDYGQLQCIGFGDVLLDLINSDIIPVAKLTEIHRQAQASAIITESIKVRNQEHIIGLGEEGHKVLGELQDLEIDVTTDRSKIQNKVIKYFKEGLERENGNIMEVQVVCATRTRGDLSTFEINQIIKDLVNPIDTEESEEDVEEDIFSVASKATERVAECQVDKGHKYRITKGDKIIITKNNRKALVWDKKSECFNTGMVCNGNMGIVKEIGIDYMDADIVGVGLVRIEKKKFNDVELAYACTCHKLQGSQANYVVIAVDSGAWMMLCCEWLYTAITRGKKHGVIAGETKAVRRCSSFAQGNTKLTFLPSFLEEWKERVKELKRCVDK